MTRPTFWSRFFVENLSFNGSTGNFHQVMATLAPGQTLLRTIVTQDIAISATSAPDTDVGICNPFGIHLATSNSAPGIDPYADAANINPGWIYWDQALFRFEYFTSGSPNIWSARSDDNSRHFDTTAQRTNKTAANEYLWWSWAPSTFVNWVSAGMQAFGSVSLQALIMEAP